MLQAARERERLLPAPTRKCCSPSSSTHPSTGDSPLIVARVEFDAAGRVIAYHVRQNGENANSRQYMLAARVLCGFAGFLKSPNGVDKSERNVTAPRNVDSNLDAKTVKGFGDEWTAFDQSDLPDAEREQIFGAYFLQFPWDSLPAEAEGFDLGCGSGRWAELVARRVGRLHCIDASDAALGVARRCLAGSPQVMFHLASVDAIPLADASQDFGYSLGVLHHVPDTAKGLAACVRKLKPGAPLLVYLYYRFDNRPVWYRLLWRVSDVLRRSISRVPSQLRRVITDTIAAFVYWPLARVASLVEAFGLNVGTWPLAAYRDKSFYTMRTDALDRFGTHLEQRFTRVEIDDMMRRVGLDRIRFNECAPYWVAIGWRRSDGKLPVD